MEKKVRKLGKKLLAALLSVALIAGAVNLVPMEVSAEGANLTPAATGAEDLSFTGAQLAKNWNTSSNATLDSTTGQWTVEFTGLTDYPQISFALPESVDLTKCNSITFAVSSSTVILDYQVFGVNGEKSTDYYIVPGQTLYTFNPEADNTALDYTANEIRIMLDGNNTEAGSFVFDGIYFDMEADTTGDGGGQGSGVANITPAKSGQEDFSWTGAQIAKNWNTSSNATLDSTTGQWTVEFTGLTDYPQISFALPESVDLTKCNSITFSVSSSTVILDYQVFGVNGEKSTDYYIVPGQTLYTFNPEADNTALDYTANEIRIMLDGNNTEAGSFVFDGIYFDMEADTTGEGGGGTATNITPAGGSEDFSYTSDKLGVWWENASSALNGTQQEITFAGLYTSSKFGLPSGIDLTNAKSVTFAVSAQNCTLAFKVHTEKDPSDSQAEIEQYGCAGQNLYTIDLSAYNSTASAISVMLNNATTEEGAASTCVFDGVYFDMKNDEELGNGSDEPAVDETANITPAVSSTEDKSWKASDLTGVSASSGSVTELGGPNNDEWKIAFNGQYGEWKVALPEEIDLTMLDTLSFYVSQQNCSLSFKIYSGDRVVKALYGYTGQTKYDIQLTGLTDVITHVGVMTGDTASGMKCSLDGIYVDMLTARTETYTDTFTASDLVVASSDVTSAQLVNGKWEIQYGSLYQTVKFALPKKVNFSKCLAMIITVSSQVGPVNFYAYSEGADAGTFNYNIDSTEYVLSPEKDMKVDTIGIQVGGNPIEAGAKITVESISFLMEGKKPLPLPEDTDDDGQVAVAPTFFVNVETSANVTVEEKVVGGQTVSEIEFAQVNDYVDFEIPDTVDIAHLATIALDLEVVAGAGSQSLEGQTVEGLEISLLDANKSVIVSGNVDVLQVGGNENAKYIRVKTTVANQTIQLATVTFEIDMTIVGDIVKGGYFTDADDLENFWTLSGATGTIHSGNSEIAPNTGIYTWAEISNRDRLNDDGTLHNGNYDCFQQDITARVEPGKYYAITFWAKLSDDYAGEEANMRTVCFNPYHANAGGTVYGQVPLGGTVQQVLEVGQWTKFVTLMQVPADATSFTIRIMEQGEPSQYGSGPGVMGSYAVAGVSMQETTPFAATNNYGGGKFYDTREVVCSQGYAMEDVVLDWASAVVEKTEDGALKLNFNKQYDEARFKLPRSYEASEIIQFMVDISGTNVPLALKLYSKGTMVRVEWINTIWENGHTLSVFPNLDSTIDGFGLMALSLPVEDCYATITGVNITFAEEPDPVPRRATIAANGDFSNEDLSDWHASYWGQEEGVSMFREVSDKPFGDGSTYFISYNKRTSPYQCFAQDITGYVEQNEIYTFSFWAKLSDDYIGAPDTQRVVQFSPYTVDKNGVSDYNPTLEGTYIQVLEPGVWTKFEGKYKVTNANEIASVVIRILEQGTDYGTGDCVLGGYSIADFKMDVYVPEPPSIDEEVPDLDDAITAVFGEDFIVGNTLALNTLDDIGTEMILNKHFNALTIGNELKPDALFGYSNTQHTALQTITYNGQEVVVPTLDFSRAEMILDKIVKWNKQNPDHQFKVRGHVLVWHSQTPEWFFRENYEVGQNADGSENYVTPEVMNLRLEWYIQTVLEHFTGEDSEYKDLFYGWDVVNEAVSDGSGTYRTDKIANGEKPSDPTHGSNSSWWAVYGSNEFIIKAFQFANKYAPADLELYYNDYNECNNTKVKGIVKLLEDVLAAEGTRIDAMGMQAHHNLMNPSNKMIEDAIRAYAAVVGNVQITEFDFKASRALTSEKNIQDEYAEQAKRYYEIYEILKKLDAEDGINITGITFWGVSDKDSWLQSSSNVGGGSDGSVTQCPLLFDSNYKVKPAYWAFVDYSVVDAEYTYEPTEIPQNETPMGDVELEEPKEEVKDEISQAPGADVSSGEVVTPQPKKANAVPFVAGGIAVMVIGVGAAVWFLKKKK